MAVSPPAKESGSRTLRKGIVMDEAKESNQEAATEEKESNQAEKQVETKPEMVPKERMDAVSAENKSLKEQNELMQQNQALLRANPPAASQVKQTDPWEIEGLEGDDDIPNVGQQKKVLGRIMGGVRSEITQLRFLYDHPDFSEIVGTREQIQTGQWAAPLNEAIKANPMLMATIVNSADPYAAAYTVAKIHAKKKAEGDTTKTTKTEAEAAIDEAVENSKRVKTSANTKGGEGLSEQGRVANMSDAEFIDAFNKAGGDL